MSLRTTCPYNIVSHLIPRCISAMATKIHPLYGRCLCPWQKKGSERLSAEDRVHFLVLGFLKLDVQIKLCFCSQGRKIKLHARLSYPMPQGRSRRRVGRVAHLPGSLMLPLLQQEPRQCAQTRHLTCR